MEPNILLCLYTRICPRLHIRLSKAALIIKGRDFMIPTRQLGWAILVLNVLSSSAAAQLDSTISVHGLGGISLCESLTSVLDRFPSARDTLLESEGQKWPAKEVPLGNYRIRFEASWIDPTHIWRISTTSPHYR